MAKGVWPSPDTRGGTGTWHGCLEQPRTWHRSFPCPDATWCAQEIAKHFEHKAGDDYELVLEAIDTMTCVAWYINDMKRKHEHAIRQQVGTGGTAGRHPGGGEWHHVTQEVGTMAGVVTLLVSVSMQEIQSLLLGWKGPDLTSYGELVLEGTFRAQRVRHDRALFLFDKALLITKRRGDHYVYKSHIPVRDKDRRL